MLFFIRRVNFDDIISNESKFEIIFHFFSRYPVILSIENHCTIPQQRNMAAAFREIFGDMLLAEPIDSNGNALPSPNQLKRKIIIKVALSFVCSWRFYRPN